MPIGKRFIGYSCAAVDQYREDMLKEREQQLTELEERLGECRTKIDGLLSQNERMITELDEYNDQDRSIANRVWEQVRTLEEVRHQNGLQIKAAVDLTRDKLERLDEFYKLLDTIRYKINGLSSELAEAGRFGSASQGIPQTADQAQERGEHLEV